MPTMLKLAVVGTLSLLVVGILLLWMRAATTPPNHPEATRKIEVQTAVIQPDPLPPNRPALSCEDLIDTYREEIEKYRTCTDDDDCRHVRSGWLPMLAANRQFSRQIETRVAALAEACGDRPSHDVFYSDYGIDIACEKQLCSVSEITSEDMRDQLRRESRRVLVQSDETKR